MTRLLPPCSRLPTRKKLTNVPPTLTLTLPNPPPGELLEAKGRTTEGIDFYTFKFSAPLDASLPRPKSQKASQLIELYQVPYPYPNPLPPCCARCAPPPPCLQMLHATCSCIPILPPGQPLTPSPPYRLTA